MLPRWLDSFDRYSECLARALTQLHARAALIDREVVVLDSSGRSDFQALQNSLVTGRETRYVYYAFDRLHLDGQDLRSLPLVERKGLLAVLIGEGDERLHYSDHVIGHGRAVFSAVCAQHAEGIVSKRFGAAVAGTQAGRRSAARVML